MIGYIRPSHPTIYWIFFALILMSNSHFVQEFFIYIEAIFDAFPNYEYRNIGLLFFSEKSSGSNFEYCEKIGRLQRDLKYPPDLIT